MYKINTLLVLIIGSLSIGCNKKEQFQITDLHVHLKGNFDFEDAVIKSEAENIGYGIAFNCGLGFPVHKDSQIDSVLMIMEDYPQFYVGMQAEGREWINIFSEERMDKVINAAIENNIAIEINNRFSIPSEKFIKRAKAAGTKFTVGTNNADENFSGAKYAREMIEKCQLTEEDFFLPVKKQIHGQS